MIDPFNHPPGWSLQLEILASLSTVPQPLADLASEFGVSPQAVRGALFGVEGVCIGGNAEAGLTLWIAPHAREAIRQRVIVYWNAVYEHEPALA
jgi:hypothetical protein